MSTATSNASHAHVTRGYTLALVSAAVLSTTAIFIRHLTQTYHMPPLVLAFWRDAFVALTLVPVLAWLGPRLLRVHGLRVQGQHLRYLLGYGFVLAIFNALWTLSVALNGAAIATVLVYCSAGFTALLGWWFLKERLDWTKGVAVAFSLGGCVLVSGALFLLAAGPTVIGFGLYNVSLSHLPSSVANLIVTLEPAFTALIAYLLLGERLTGIQIGGSLLILAGVVFLRLYEGWLAVRVQPRAG